MLNDKKCWLGKIMNDNLCLVQVIWKHLIVLHLFKYEMKNVLFSFMIYNIIKLLLI